MRLGRYKIRKNFVFQVQMRKGERSINKYGQAEYAYGVLQQLSEKLLAEGILTEEQLKQLNALNKEDCVTRETTFATLEKLNKIEGLKAIVPISAKKGDNLEVLKEELVSLLPEGAPMYPDDMYTESSMRFMATEIIREKALYLLDKEVPYGIGLSLIHI